MHFDNTINCNWDKINCDQDINCDKETIDQEQIQIICDELICLWYFKGGASKEVLSDDTHAEKPAALYLCWFGWGLKWAYGGGWLGVGVKHALCSVSQGPAQGEWLFSLAFAFPPKLGSTRWSPLYAYGSSPSSC